MTKKKKGKARVSEETFDVFLASQGMLAACEDHAIKEIIAGQVAGAMKAEGIGKTEMAARMQTSCRQLDRLFESRSRRLPAQPTHPAGACEWNWFAIAEPSRTRR